MNTRPSLTYNNQTERSSRQHELYSREPIIVLYLRQKYSICLPVDPITRQPHAAALPLTQSLCKFAGCLAMVILRSKRSNANFNQCPKCTDSHQLRNPRHVGQNGHAKAMRDLSRPRATQTVILTRQLKTAQTPRGATNRHMTTASSTNSDRRKTGDDCSSIAEQSVEDVEAQNFWSTPVGEHPHHHFSGRAPWLRAGVLGANDGEAPMAEASQT